MPSAALLDGGGPLTRLYALEAAARQDPAKGMAEWGAWRVKTTARLQEIIQHGREAGKRYFPDTNQKFCESFVFAGLFQEESRAFTAKGQPHHETGTFKGLTQDQVLALFHTLEGGFRKETAYYRLVLLNGLFSASSEELSSQASRPDAVRWNRKRKEWNEILSLWAGDLGQEGPPDVKAVLHGKALSAIGAAVTDWWNAEEAKLFHPEKPEAAERDARKQAVKDLAQKVKALLEK